MLQRGRVHAEASSGTASPSVRLGNRINLNTHFADAPRRARCNDKTVVLSPVRLPMFRSRAYRRAANPPGFTLIELLVVIAIIAVLAALALVAHRSAVTKADTAKSLAKMRGVAAGVLAFAADNNGRMPWVYGNSGGGIYAIPNSIRTAPDGTVGKDFPLNTEGGWIWALINRLGMSPSDFVTPRSGNVPLVDGKSGRGALPAFTLNFNLELFEHNPKRGGSIEIPWSLLPRYSSPSRTIMLSEISFQGEELNLREWAWYNAWGTIGIRAATQNKRDGISKSPFVFFDGHAELLAPEETIKDNTSRWIDPSWYPNKSFNSEREASRHLRGLL
jgi:prepilin-type N-terminal cleavage/methylation domain-containing protein